MSKQLNVKGQKFGMLTVLYDARVPKGTARASRVRNRYVRCQCDCGKTTAVRIDHLRRGATRSCGCLQQQMIFARQLEAIAPKDRVFPGTNLQAQYDELQRASSALSQAALEAAEATPRYPRPTPQEKAHGLPPGEYARMMTEQGGVCKICGTPPGVDALQVDHCHTTEKVRGLLCSLCNSGLGFFQDSFTRLAGAMKYLHDASL